MTHRFSGAAAAAYDAGRAPYVPEVVAALDLPAPPSRVVDLAAGTGLLGRVLVAAGHEVVAVEPDPEMAARQPDGVERVLARAEATGLPAGCADAVTVGDAWHWFAPEAADEVHRLLVPRGRLAVVWRGSIADERPPALARYFEVLARAREDAPPFHGGEQGPEHLPAHPGFAPLVHRQVRFVHRTSRPGLLAEAASTSYVNVLEERDAFLEELEVALDGVGEVEVPYRGDVWLTRRRRD